MNVKPKRCQFCRESYTPARTTQKVCSMQCAINLTEKDKLKVFSKETRRRKEKLKSKAQWIKEAQIEFNKFIRLRDASALCISCDRTKSEIEGNDNWKLGGAWDCGHFLTRGARPELRFEELNAYKQCKSCNGGSGKFTKKNDTVCKAYREKLIKKIGIDKVEWLEGPHEPLKLSIDDIKEIKAKYKAKCKELST